MAVAPSARAGGATVVTAVAMAVAKPKSANRLILLVVVHIVILLGVRAMEWTPADCLACTLQAISPTRSVAAWTVKCNETVIISGVRIYWRHVVEGTTPEVDVAIIESLGIRELAMLRHRLLTVHDVLSATLWC